AEDQVWVTEQVALHHGVRWVPQQPLPDGRSWIRAKTLEVVTMVRELPEDVLQVIQGEEGNMPTMVVLLVTRCVGELSKLNEARQVPPELDVGRVGQASSAWLAHPEALTGKLLRIEDVLDEIQSGDQIDRVVRKHVQTCHVDIQTGELVPLCRRWSIAVLCDVDHPTALELAS